MKDNFGVSNVYQDIKQRVVIATIQISLIVIILLPKILNIPAMTVLKTII